jgi:hypothetical protein
MSFELQIFSTKHKKLLLVRVENLSKKTENLLRLVWCHLDDDKIIRIIEELKKLFYMEIIKDEDKSKILQLEDQILKNQRDQQEIGYFA